ncbi:5047_t:CDS:2 [Acaulospora morrowiae]|uniref:5047_t:CDS:1 n=1 Tax=Acaulospora morrowiae TaxID=94023 RepID=A0A9N9F8H6_9GLOM|nr:5047_t:CDS:2 [Acaulospora morrowiae]
MFSIPSKLLSSVFGKDEEQNSAENENPDEVQQTPASPIPTIEAAEFAVPSISTPKIESSNHDENPPTFPLVDGPQRVKSSSNFLSTTSTKATSLEKVNKLRKKFALEPGHSPLDWARLKNSEADLRGVTEIKTYTLEELKQHRTKDDAWTALNGKIYNITPYLKFHPGGEKELMRAAAKDGTKLFMQTHSWVNYDFMLDKCFVGYLNGEQHSLPPSSENNNRD